MEKQKKKTCTHTTYPATSYLMREGSDDTAEDEHDDELDKGENNARQEEDLVLVVVVTVPELVVGARRLHHPHRHEEPVETQHRQGLQQPRPRQPPLVLQEGRRGMS